MTNTEKSRLWREKIGVEGYRAYKRGQYAKHREHVLAKNKRWKDANPEKVAEGLKRWYANNRERQNAYSLAYYHKNKERCKSWGSPEAKARNMERFKAWTASLSPEQEREMKRVSYAKYMAKFRDVVNAKRRERHDPVKAKLTREKYRVTHPERVKILGRKGRSVRRARERAARIGDLAAIQKVYERCAELRQWFTDLVVDHVIPLAKGGAHEAKNLQIIYRRENEKKYNRLDYKPQVIFT